MHVTEGFLLLSLPFFFSLTVSSLFQLSRLPSLRQKEKIPQHVGLYVWRATGTGGVTATGKRSDI